MSHLTIYSWLLLIPNAHPTQLSLGGAIKHSTADSSCPEIIYCLFLLSTASLLLQLTINSWLLLF